MSLALTLISGNTSRAVTVTPSLCVIAGWTGRDQVSMEKHIRELEDIGVKRPAFTPTFYRVSETRLTTADRIEVMGGASSGEVEFVMLSYGKQYWIGVGSDHTDRDVETYDVTVSKQMCEKPISSTFIALNDLAPHWDELVLRSYIVESNKRTLYQEGPVTKMRDPRELAALYEWEGAGLPEGAIMFCGTLAAIGGIRPSNHFAFELEDPRGARKLQHAYDIRSMPRFANTRALPA